VFWQSLAPEHKADWTPLPSEDASDHLLIEIDTYSGAQHPSGASPLTQSTVPEQLTAIRSETASPTEERVPGTATIRGGVDAVRAFLQRSEVRLSTMHRVAGSFLGGAGLLVLMPVLFNNVIFDIMASLWAELFSVLVSGARALQRLTYLMSATFAVIVSVGIPLYALYLLLRDIVLFYFSAHNYGHDDEGTFRPRFALSALAFAPDESAEVKRDIVLEQCTPSLIHFLLPWEAGPSQATAGADDALGIAEADVSEREHKTVRHLDVLDRTAVIPRFRKRILKAKLESVAATGFYTGDQLKTQILRFHASLGLAGAVDRELVQEAAKMEASLARHALALRILVLRYAKALILLLWTTTL
jgi:hypothetical protein